MKNLFCFVLIFCFSVFGTTALAYEPEIEDEYYEDWEFEVLEDEVIDWDLGEAEYNPFLDSDIQTMEDEEFAEEAPLGGLDRGKFPTVWHWPFSGCRYISCGYGQGAHTGQDHYAIDWNLAGSADCGVGVYTPITSWIKYAGWKSGYGNTIIGQSDEGYLWRVAHLKNISVSAGQRCGKGRKLGTVGNTGNSTGCHLHFVVYKGSYSGNGNISGYSVRQNGIDNDWDLRVGWRYCRR